MRHFLVCPDFISFAAKDHNIFFDVLTYITHESSLVNVYIDDQGVILDEYKKIALMDGNAIISFWLGFMAEKGMFRKKRASLRNNYNYRDCLIDVAKSIYSERSIIVLNSDDYEEYNNELESYSIELVDRKNAKSYLSTRCEYYSDFSHKKLLDDLLMVIVNMLQRKLTHKLENLHNDNIVTSLRARGYSASDQERGGCSESGEDAGELDMVVRNINGIPVSIVEFFRTTSVGGENTVISKHVNKLLNKYDMIGNRVNYIVVYSEARGFDRSWKNYIEYMSDINNKIDFEDEKTPLISFEDTEDELCDKTEIRIGRAVHRRNNRDIEVFHVFANFSGA